MTDKHDHLDDFELDALFASARKADPEPSPDFMARLFGDIDMVSAEVPPADAVRGGLFASIWDAVGGWIGASGLAAATAAGVWVGVVSPSSLDNVTNAFFGDSVSVSLFASEDVLGVDG
ncbi:hypothetical protein HCZ30_08020 [Marivivens donghaensis]|uniref:Dihydroorotate dehydrogenase n=1 Tax=Marivivens donghaensis TaxID=1699413 RepID=A0ABX0VWA5_9RHOB|nr:hypothetical protein [Marivivens donghaensis]NIY72382.1 hypothetical protein [Marivivens donghaensis]